MGARSLLPQLLKEDASTWNSMRITYEYPHVRRLWKPMGEPYRIYLHAIEPIPRDAVMMGARPYQHKHPWPSGVMVMNGRYRMVLSRGGINNEFVLDGGSSYVMTHPDEEHFVEPADYEVLSLMVSGQPFSAEKDEPRKMIPKQEELTLDERTHILQAFKTLLYLRPVIGQK